MSDQDYEDLVMLLEFKEGATLRKLAKRFKRPIAEIEQIIREKPAQLSKYKPLARR